MLKETCNMLQQWTIAAVVALWAMLHATSIFNAMLLRNGVKNRLA